MNLIFNIWENIDTTRLIIQIMMICIVSIGYIILVIIDFKYKEMWFLQELSVGIINCIFLIIAVAIWGAKSFIVPLIISCVVWLILVLINGILTIKNKNKKTIIGEADIDLFSLQFCLSSGYLIWLVLNNDTDLKYINAIFILESMLSSLLIGLIITVFIWFINLLYIYKFKNPQKEKINIIYKEQKQVPLLLSIVILVIVNMLIIMGT